MSDQQQPPRRRPVVTTPTPSGAPAPGVPAPATRTAGSTPAASGPSAAAATARRPVAGPAAPLPAAAQAHVERVMEAGFQPQKLNVTAGFQPRNGDVLHVTYPKVVLPLKVQYASVHVGEMSYTRQLAEGDDVVAETEAIYAFLAGVSAETGVEKVKQWAKELEQAHGGSR